MEVTPNQVTKKFIAEVEKLIANGTAANYAEITVAIDWNKSGMSQVVKGKRNVPIAIYRKFTEAYNIPATEEDKAGVNGQEGAKNGFKSEDTFKDKYIALLESQLNSVKQLQEYAKANQAIARTLLQQVKNLRVKVEKIDPVQVQQEINKSIDEQLTVLEKAGKYF